MGGGPIQTLAFLNSNKKNQGSKSFQDIFNLEFLDLRHWRSFLRKEVYCCLSKTNFLFSLFQVRGNQERAGWGRWRRHCCQNKIHLKKLISIFLPGRANIKSDYMCLYIHAFSSACLHLGCFGPFINFSSRASKTFLERIPWWEPIMCQVEYDQ